MGFVKGKLRLLRREGLRGEGGGAADAAGYGLLTQAGCVEGLGAVKSFGSVKSFV